MMEERQRLDGKHNMARAWHITGDGGLSSLRLADVPPEPLGQGQLRLRCRAVSINYRDYSTVMNPKARGLALPFVPNSDAGCEVSEIGPGVAEFAVGDRVATCFFQDWADGPCTPEVMASALGGARPGVLREELVLDSGGVVRVPEHMGLLEAATLPCAALTAWNALVEVGDVQQGDVVLLLGTGGVSIFALQFAVLLGAKAIVTSSSDDKLEIARAMGAWQTINYRDELDWPARVQALTGGRGADLTVEVGGPGTLASSIEATRVAGRIALIGVLTKGVIDPTPIMRKSLRVQGVYVGSKHMFIDMKRAIEARRLMPVIDRTFAFEDAPDAFAAMAAAQHVGKLVVIV